MSNYYFPKGFLWGTASSSYQTEGNNQNSDWYIEEQLDGMKPGPERRLNGPCGIACDHWNRYREDYDCAEELGVNIHRTSIEWSRIFIEEDQTDKTALEHYKQMLMNLNARGIKVMLCLHHFTIPRWVYEKGGLENRNYILEHFKRYAQLIVRELGEFVDYWLPVNEPNIIAINGYFSGLFPPYRKKPLQYFKVLKTILQMHLAAYDIIKNDYPERPVGVSFAFLHFQPFNHKNPIDRISTKITDRLMNLILLEGINGGRFHFFHRKHMNLRGGKQKLDFMGVNYYSTRYIKGMHPIKSKSGDIVTDMGWIHYPKGLEDVLQYLHRNFSIPIMITENGVPTGNESERIKYIHEHLRVIAQAIENGVDIRGYMHWSLTDNFEWDMGYSMRFGLVHIDYKTQQRTIKEGGRWLAKIIRENSIALDP